MGIFDRLFRTTKIKESEDQKPREGVLEEPRDEIFEEMRYPSVERLIRDLEHKDPKIQIAAAKDLGTIGRIKIEKERERHPGLRIHGLREEEGLRKRIPDPLYDQDVYDNENQEVLLELVRALRNIGSIDSLEFFCHIYACEHRLCREKTSRTLQIREESADAIREIEELDREVISKQKGEIPLPNNSVDLIEELIQIGRRKVIDNWSDSHFTTIARDRTREIGMKLYELGGHSEMKAASNKVMAQLGYQAASELNLAWNGIGEWMA